MNHLALAEIADRLRRQTLGTQGADDHGNPADCIWMLSHQGVTLNLEKTRMERIGCFRISSCLF
ncbi:hypothetical protein OAH34_01090 [bacterium]|nr:hypothetical protein [bacterium]